MKGSAEVVRTLIVFAVVSGCLANKPKKLFKKYPPPQQRNDGAPFLPFLNGPPVPPFALSPLEKANSQPPTDPYACLPKYLCVVKNKKGEKRTTIVHGLHPALRKAKPDVIDPASFNVGGTKTFPPPSVSDATDDDMFRDREFDDSFLKQQEANENMAFIEEKRRQFLYGQGQSTQVVLPKAKPNKKTEESKESTEEEEEKSQEVSKEEKEEVEKSVEEKEEPESVEEEEEAESSAEIVQTTGPKLDKYKIKKKAYANKLKSNGFKSRMDDFDENDDHLATVPWDDRVTNDSDVLKPKEIYDKLFGKVLPFQLSLPKIAKSIPGMSFLASSDEVTTTTTAKPGLFKRMLKAVTGSAPEPPTLKQRYGVPMYRHKRDAEENAKYVTKDVKIVNQIRDPARQCRMIYKGCDLPYDHIMKMVSAGQVLIENEDEEDAPVTKKPVPANPSSDQDDEAEQAVRDKVVHKKSKPIPELLAQAHLGGKKKVAPFGKNKKPVYQGSEEEDSNESYQSPSPKKSVASLPILPMRYHWGKPSYTVHGKPSYSEGPAAFSGGVLDKNMFNRTPPPPKPTAPTTTTTERPIFAAAPLDKKDNLTAPTFQHSVIKLNKTHAVHVLKKKAYNPAKTRTRDAKGRPVSFSTVFSEIAGHSGGIHDFFDRISGAFGGDGTRESGRELTGPFPGPPKRGNSDRHPEGPMAKPTAFPQAPIPPDHIEKEDDDGNSAERDDEDGSDEDEDDGDEQDEEGDEGNDEDEDEEEDDDVGPRPHPAMQQQQYKQPKPTGEPQNAQLDNLPPPIGGTNSEEDVYQAGAFKGKENPQKRPGRPPKPEEQEDEEENEEDEVKNKRRPGKPPRPGQPEDEEENEEDDGKHKRRPGKPPRPGQPHDEEENDEEEGNDDDEGELDLPDTIPAFIKESMIKEHEKKKQEKEQGGGDEDEEEDDQQQDGPQQGGPGGPQQGGPPGGPGGYGGGGGLFGSSQGPPKQGGGLFGSSQGPPKKAGGLFSFLG